MAKQEDEEDWGPPEYGVRSSDLGSFIPEGTYRPLPIVWCAGAWLIQVFVLPWLWWLTSYLSPWVTALAAGLVTFWIAHWTWRRGMAQASATWQILTAVLLAINLAAVAIGAFLEVGQTT